MYEIYLNKIYYISTKHISKWNNVIYNSSNMAK